MNKRGPAVIAELINIQDLDPEAAEYLLQDAEYKIRQIIEIASKFMRKSRRRVLQVSDIQYALKHLGIPPIFGYPNSTTGYSKIPNMDDTWVLEDNEITLNDFVKQKFEMPRDIQLHSH